MLGESERGRLGLEFALRDIRARLIRLEAAINPAARAGAGPSGGPKGQAPNASAGAGVSGGPKDPPSK